MKNFLTCFVGLLAIIHTFGCASSKTSNTARTATEQMLLSNAIDRSLSNVSFDQMAGRKVFIDDKYLESVDKGYVMGSLRHKTLAAGASLAKSADDADLVLEARSGGIGTDTEDSFIGIPSIGVPGMPITIPDMKFISHSKQIGTSKLGLVAYDPKTGSGFGLGGQSTALTKHDDTYILGMGPFRSGAIRQERENAIGFEPPTGVFAALTGQTPERMARRGVINLVDGPPTQVAGLPNPMLIESTKR